MPATESTLYESAGRKSTSQRVAGDGGLFQRAYDGCPYGTMPETTELKLHARCSKRFAALVQGQKIVPSLHFYSATRMHTISAQHFERSMLLAAQESVASTASKWTQPGELREQKKSKSAMLKTSTSKHVATIEIRWLVYDRRQHEGGPPASPIARCLPGATLFEHLQRVSYSNASAAQQLPEKQSSLQTTLATPFSNLWIA